MKTLTIMRHAKSSWGDSSLRDFDRPLNERGCKAARRIGRELKRRKVRFDAVIASPARRVRETLDGVAQGYGEIFDIRFEEDIYAASTGTLLGLVRGLEPTVHAPLFVGHNPGLHYLVLQLARESDALRAKVEDKFPTGAVAMIELSAVRWDEVEPNSGTIRELILPRELD